MPCLFILIKEAFPPLRAVSSELKHRAGLFVATILLTLLQDCGLSWVYVVK